ncbi:outer membrane protein assembly factor BamB family protein [Phaeovulum sp. W22_SRMD_FR3]|uniref:PQQ-like beta-propeller repeat protein n=1 Tax=Phaeovulum sp. W22_SRMD_FR3 TaxID=3240274 RepID=UPI003F9A69FF
MTLTQRIGLVSLLALATACAPKEPILQGERLAPRDLLTGVVAGPSATPVPGAALPALRLPGVQANAEWTHRAGNAAHDLVQAALPGGGLTPVWSANVGTGGGRKHRITADPVVGAGRIYTLDSRSDVTATATNGATLWTADLSPASESADDASGGGLAYDAGTVYATTGFGELIALDAATGAVRWRQDFDAAVGGAPTVRDGMVYVVARDASGWAIRASDGRVQWQLPGTPSPSGVTGVSAPAANATTVVFPFASGEMVTSLRKSGLNLWTAKVAGARLGRAYASVTDLTGDPVIVGNVVYAGSSAGKLGAFDLATGERIWTAPEGAVSPVQVAGGSIFLVSDESQLMRIDAATGDALWSVALPYFTKEKVKKQNEIVAHYGPVLAGGRLFVASGDGALQAFDPATGALLGQAAIPGGASSAPVVAGGTLYVLGENAQLHAFR